MTETTQDTPTGPSFELGQVNVDSLKEILNQLGNTYPWQDEASKLAYHDQVNSIGEAGDPRVASDEAEISDLEKQVAALQAQLDAANAAKAEPAAGTPQGGTN